MTGRDPALVAAGALGYEVSNHGRLRRYSWPLESTIDPRTKQPVLEVEGFETPVFLTMVVAEAFLPNPYGSHRVRRKTKGVTNTRADNLEWRLEPSAKIPPYHLRELPDEQWVAVAGRPGYTVSNRGRVEFQGKRIRPLTKAHGEPTVFLYVMGLCKGALVKDLVGQAFLPHPGGPARVERVAGAPPRSCDADHLLWVTAPSSRFMRPGRRRP